MAVLGLLRSEPRVATAAIISSSNNWWPASFLFGAVFVSYPAPLTGHGGVGRACWELVTCGCGGGGGVAAPACVCMASGGGFRCTSPLLLCFRPALVARVSRSGWGAGSQPPFLHQARLPLHHLPRGFSFPPGRLWWRGGGQVWPLDGLQHGEPSFGDSALCGTSSASATSCRCDSRPHGWPRCARCCDLRELFPLYEDLLQVWGGI
jgi:hypothetical protein